MEGEQLYESKTVVILLIIASLILMGNGVYTIQIFSVQQGIGAGAYVQANQSHVNVTPALQYVVGNLNVINQTILESYLLFAIGFVMCGIAFLILIHGASKYEDYVIRYIPTHLLLALVYAGLVLAIYATYGDSLITKHLYVTYFALALCFVFGIYMGYQMRKTIAKRKVTRSISIDPSKPYTNLVNLRERLFDNLSGEVRIVDKHFNSGAVTNLHRLMPMESSRINSYRIITSPEMLDTGFVSNYRDLKSELANRGIELEIKVMGREDASSQHERFMFDGSSAYKIPPFNIINKKSEHIVKMNLRDAQKRFEYLHQNSTKIENYTGEQQKNGLV